jgi:hypothetical protein
MPITPVPPPPNVHGPAFAIYRPVPVSLPQAYQGYTLPVDLETVRNPGNFSFNPRQNALLAQNGFVVVPAPWLEFFQVYQQNRYHIPSFVTTDAVYHIYHLVFGKMLRDLERESFAPDIAALTRACGETAQSLYQQLQGTSLEPAARRVWAYFSVADALIHPDTAVPAEVADWVNEELDRIYGHSGERGQPPLRLCGGLLSVRAARPLHQKRATPAVLPNNDVVRAHADAPAIPRRNADGPADYLHPATYHCERRASRRSLGATL